MKQSLRVYRFGEMVVATVSKIEAAKRFRCTYYDFSMHGSEQVEQDASDVALTKPGTVFLKHDRTWVALRDR